MSFIDVLDDVLGDPEINVEKLHDLMNQTLFFLKEVREKAASKDPQLMEEALADTVRMQKILETKIQALCEETGLSPQELSLLGADTSKMTPEQGLFIQSLNEQFDKMKKKKSASSKISLRPASYA